MVVTLIWINSWVVVAVSICALVVIMVFLACCTCCDDKDDTMSQLYVLSESGLYKSENDTASSNDHTEPGFFRRFSAGNVANTLSILKISSTPNQHYLSTKSRSNSENELLDSTNTTNEFGDAVLQIDGSSKRSSKVSQMEEDVLSFISDESRYTYYSTYPLTRGDSIAETMKSAISHVDLDTL